jgi:hypothetical protein
MFYFLCIFGITIEIIMNVELLFLVMYGDRW